MTTEPDAVEDRPGPIPRFGGLRDLLRFAGFRYWPASVLPALVGTTLPFWLRPPGFAFDWLAGLEFLVATVLVHAGFSLLRARIDGEKTRVWPRTLLPRSAAVCIAAGSLLMLHLSRSVPGGALYVFGVVALFTGVLYVVPPFSFRWRAAREIVLCEGFGLLPVLGAYLVQTGDLTRTVYIAALPLFVATGLWVWMDELIDARRDVAAGHGSLVALFGSRFSGRLGTLALTSLLYAVLVAAVVTGSASPVSLVVLLSLGFAVPIVTTAWKGYDDPSRLDDARRHAAKLHALVGIAMALSSLVPSSVLP